MAEEGLICWACSKPTGMTSKPMRTDCCPHCRADLRCCRGCRHFDPTKRSQCRETIDQPVPNKEKNNFCEWYQVRTVTKRGGGVDTSFSETKDDRKKGFDDLFK